MKKYRRAARLICLTYLLVSILSISGCTSGKKAETGAVPQDGQSFYATDQYLDMELDENGSLATPGPDLTISTTGTFRIALSLNRCRGRNA